MSTYSVQFGPMQEATEGLQNVYQRLSQIGEDLNQQVASGTVEFQGNTKEDFMAAQKVYSAAQAELAQSLQEATGALGDIHTEYNLAETKGAALWGH